MAFYKLADGQVLIAPNFVAAPGYTLEASEKDTYDYPVDGWRWFDSDGEAAAHFGIAVGVESALSIQPNWQKFNDSIPVAVSQQMLASPMLMMRLMRLEIGSEFKGSSDKLIEYWSLLDKDFLTDSMRTQLNSLAENCSIPIRLDESGEMIVL